MKIAVISDTHWRTWDPEDILTNCLIEALEAGYDAIWHAGDVEEHGILKALEEFAPVVCVKGNCDNYMVRHLPHSVTEKIEGVKLGMIHGWDLPLDHAAAICARFAEDVNIVIHGHTHRRRFQEWTSATGAKITIINPGSVSSPRGGEMPGMGELVIESGQWNYRAFSFDF